MKGPCDLCGNVWRGLSRWGTCCEDLGWQKKQDGLLLQAEGGINMFRLRVDWGQEAYCDHSYDLEQLFTDY